MQVLFVFLVCLAASTVGGVCGFGGGVVIKPVLDATGWMPVATVSFLSSLTVLAMATVNLWKNRGSGELDAARSVPLGLGAAVGGVLGKQTFTALKAALRADRTVGAVQAVVLGLMMLATLLYVCNRQRIRSREIGGVAAPVLIGVVLGILSSFLGIGGGPINLAVLYYFFSMPTKKAAVNSIMVTLLIQLASFATVLVTGAVPDFGWQELAAMASAGVAGGAVSARLHKKLSARTTDRLFMGLLCVILCICVYNTLRMLG